MVRRIYLLTSLEERGIKWVKQRWGWAEGGWGGGKRGANVFHPLGKVGNTVINREGRRKGRGGRGEEGK